MKNFSTFTKYIKGMRDFFNSIYIVEWMDKNLISANSYKHFSCPKIIKKLFLWKYVPKQRLKSYLVHGIF